MSEHARRGLPGRPSLEQLRKQAKDLLRACRNGDAAALERVRRHKPQATDPSLADAQFALAREYGFESWPRLATDPRTAPHGMSTRPPFYKIDWNEKRLEPRQPLAEKDWNTILDVVREHGITSVNAGGQMTDAVLERLSHLAQITCVHLGGTKRLTDEGLLHLARMPQLVELDLSEYPGGRLTDHGLQVLRHLPALRRFQMCWQRGISDAGVANLAFCDHLERVDLLGSPTGDGAINAPRGKRHQRHYAGQTRITDRSLEILGGMTSLEEVELSACAGISDAGLVHLVRLPRLKKVSVDASARVSRPGIAVFPAHVRVDFWT